MNKLKKFRVEAGLTQAKLAEIAGVTQSTYQRWETDKISIPDEKLKRICAVLDKTPEAILGTRAPVEAAFYDRSAPDFARYYGEVALHFRGSGEPVLFSISEQSFGQLHGDLQGNDKFVTFQSLSNETVILRVASLAEVYFSSEAYDHYGPEGQEYPHSSPVQLPDPSDWEIIEAIADDVLEMEDFPEKHIQRIKDMLALTSDEEFAKLVSEGYLTEEEIPAEKARELEKRERIFEAATNISYQLSTGQRRSFSVDCNVLYEAFWSIIEFPDAFDGDFIRIATEGYHRTMFLNPDALDYISIPTHQWEKGALDAAAEDLDAPDD